MRTLSLLLIDFRRIRPDLGSKVGKSHFPTWAIYLILSLSLTVIAIILTQRTPVIKFGRLLACIGFFTSVMWVFGK